MKIKNGFVLEKVGDSYLACATGRLASSFSGFVRMNGSGAFLWGILEKDSLDVNGLAECLVGEYGIPIEQALKDACAFVNTLIKNGILED